MKLLFIFIFSLVLFPQNNPEKMLWNENQKLTWKDFRGKPIRSANFVASTNTGIVFEYSYSQKDGDVILNYSVQSFFNPQSSWYVPDKINEHILRHEQAHFDISEIHARILRKNLHGRQFSKNVKREIENIYHQVERDRRAMQTKFDAHTDHSRNFEKEKEWQDFIAQKLDEYGAWK